jgi:hypothetical protein
LFRKFVSDCTRCSPATLPTVIVDPTTGTFDATVSPASTRRAFTCTTTADRSRLTSPLPATCTAAFFGRCPVSR